MRKISIEKIISDCDQTQCAKLLEEVGRLRAELDKANKRAEYAQGISGQGFNW